jgi:predicted phage tail component-like protein
VNFGEVGAGTFNIVSDTEIQAVASPASAGTVDVTVQTPGGTSAVSSADQFTFTDIPPSPTPVSTPGYGFTFNGTYSRDMGIAFVSKDRVLLPNINDQYIEIPMRNGSVMYPGWLSDQLIQLDCSKIFQTLPDLRLAIRQIKAWLYTVDRQILTFDDEPGKIYFGKIYTQSGGSGLGGIPLDQLLRMDNFSLPFRCAPFATSVTPHTLTGTGTAVNVGTHAAPCVISIAGPEINPSLTINGATVSWTGTLTSDQTLVIDTGKMTAVIGSTNALGSVTGIFPNPPMLLPGDNAIVADGQTTIAWNDCWI